MRPSPTLVCLVAIMTCLNLAACDGTERSAGRGTPPSPPNSPTAGVLVCVGDSLTEGYGVPEERTYPSLLRQRLAADGKPFTVINAGVSGETSSGTLSRVEWILTLQPDIVILEIGANDGLRGIDPAITRENIRAIVRALKGKGAIVILAGMEMLRNMGIPFTTAFAEIYPRIAIEEALIRIPFFLAGVAGKPHLNQADGIHPTPEGYGIVVETIYPYVLEAIRAFDNGARSEKRPDLPDKAVR